MRSLVLFPFVVACTSPTSAPDAPSWDPVRDRLAAEPTRLFIAAQPAAGSIDARRWTRDGWQDGTTAISVTNGELVVRLDASRNLAASTFALSIDPIDIPEAVFGKPEERTDGRLTLVAPATAVPQWRDEDDATATLALNLDLARSPAIDQAKTPLGTQHLA